jgi:putative transposase
MKSKRYTEEQIIHILQEVESGNPVGALCRQYGISEATVHRWCSKYKGMDQASVKRLRELEAENMRLKKIVAQQVLDLDALKELAGKEW